MQVPATFQAFQAFQLLNSLLTIFPAQTMTHPSPSALQAGHLRTHSYRALAPGPRLLVLGAVHGNEVCGTRAIEQVLAEMDAGEIPVTRGTVTLVPVTNPLAYALGQRQGDRNLNRNMRPSAIPQDFEDRIANVLCPLLEAHDVLLDLHSFHTPGAPFVMIGPQNNTGTLEPFALAEQELQLAVHTGPFRVLEGWLDTYARGVQRRASTQSSPSLVTDPNYGVGTTEYMRSRGGYAVTLECGQHEDPQGVAVARHAIRQTLALLGISPLPLMPPLTAPDILRLVDVVDRAHAGDRFAHEWRSFDAVAAGELIGTRHDGTAVKAPQDGFVVFPNPGAGVGQEWFYFAQRRA